MTHFFEQFTALCHDRGETLNAVAAKLGIPSGSVTAWKNGTMPRAATLQKLAAYFLVPVTRFFEAEPGEGERPLLRSVARLENSAITPEQDREIARFIDYLLSKRKD